MISDLALMPVALNLPPGGVAIFHLPLSRLSLTDVTSNYTSVCAPAHSRAASIATAAVVILVFIPAPSDVKRLSRRLVSGAFDCRYAK